MPKHLARDFLRLVGVEVDLDSVTCLEEQRALDIGQGLRYAVEFFRVSECDSVEGGE